jgi:hypothetical protein
MPLDVKHTLGPIPESPEHLQAYPSFTSERGDQAVLAMASAV